MNLRIFPLGSYDLLVGMDQLEKQKATANFLDKTIHYMDGEGKPMIVKGKPRPISIRQIFALQLKGTSIKGYQVYVVEVEELGKQTEKEVVVENLPVIR